MSFDALTMTAVTQELTHNLVNGRIEKINQPNDREVIIQVRQPGQTYRLLISVDPKKARIHLTKDKKVNPQVPPIFCMVLRKHLEGGRILEFTQPAYERVLSIDIEGRNDFGEPAVKTLICEIMGKHSNIILIDQATQTILDGLKRVGFTTSSYRQVLPGLPYTPPPLSGKVDPLNIDEAEFHQILIENYLEAKVTDALVKAFCGLSPQLAREVLAGADLPARLAVEQCGDWEFLKLWESLREKTSPFLTGAFQPCLVKSEQGYKTYASIILTQFPQEQIIPCDSINTALDEFYSSREQEEFTLKEQTNLRRIVEKELASLEKRRESQIEALKDAADLETDQKKGELLIANLYQLKSPGNRVELVDYYDPEGRSVSIDLDPTLTVSENAQVYFKRYAKKRNTIMKAREQLAAIEQEISYLESVLVNIDQAGSMTTLEEIREELRDTGYVKQPQLKNKKKDSGARVFQPHVFLSSNDLKILVGKNNKQNDYLTLKVAKEHDLWLHVKDLPGSHVIVVMDNVSEVPENTLTEAALLAAYYSKGRYSSKVPVDYTRRKNVTKPKGAKPGLVNYRNHQTLFVTPSDEAVKKLLSPES